MGYETKEARIALRAANKIPDKAIQFIMEQRLKIEAVKQEEKARRAQERRQRKYGKCADGVNYIDIQLLTGKATDGRFGGHKWSDLTLTCPFFFVCFVGQS